MCLCGSCVVRVHVMYVYDLLYLIIIAIGNIHIGI